MLYCTILMTNDQLNQKEFTFFISGGISMGDVPANPASDWLVDKSWHEINRVGDLPAFAEFPKNFVDNLTQWRQFYDETNPEDAKIPEPWETRLSPFQKLIVVRIVRPDKVTEKVKFSFFP